MARLEMVHTCGVRLSICLRVEPAAGRRRRKWGATGSWAIAHAPSPLGFTSCVMERSRVDETIGIRAADAPEERRPDVFLRSVVKTW